MKKLMLLTLPFFVFACGGGIEKFRGPIEELATNWGESTNKVTEFASSLNGMMTTANNMLGQLSFTQEQMASMSEENVGKYNEARTGVLNAINGFSPIQNELADVMQSWTEKTEVLQSLQEGLASGQLGPDTMEKINDLSSMSTEVSGMLETWQSNAQTQQAGVGSALEQLKSVYTMLSEK